MLVALGMAGMAGALVMLFADMVLYYPGRAEQRTATAYFACIDGAAPATGLAESSMREISHGRLMLGGALGPLAATLYALGFTQIFFVLQPRGIVTACISSIGLTAMMIFGSVYHALFAYTGFLSSAIHKEGLRTWRGYSDLVSVHRAYLQYVYRWAAVSSLAGSAAFAVAVSSQTDDDALAYPRWLAFLVPAMSAPIKLLLKRYGVGGLVLVGGLTNLWNFLFFACATYTVWCDR